MRPKVLPGHRKRIEQACNVCKRRKQKCSGNKPCTTCRKRNVECIYKGGDPSFNASVKFTTSTLKGEPSATPITVVGKATGFESQCSSRPGTPSPIRHLASQGQLQGCSPKAPQPEDAVCVANSTCIPEDEEIKAYCQPRVLQDSRRRLHFIGKSATMSFLQVLRLTVDGNSDFSLDPDRHNLLEPVSSPLCIAYSGTTLALPTKDVATVLLQSYFTHTHGLVDIFDQAAFRNSFDACYSSTPSENLSDLCLVYLTLAIGLAMANTAYGSSADTMINRLKMESPQLEDMLYSKAMYFGTYLKGFEDAQLWSVQTLCLLSVYMMVISRPSAAYAYHGMAVRSAYVLGLSNTDDTQTLFGPNEEAVRRKLWRSLYVLDQFLGATLGRPTSMSESNCSDNSLHKPKQIQISDCAIVDKEIYGAPDLDATVKSSQLIAKILRKIYSKEMISTQRALKMADTWELWTENKSHFSEENRLCVGDASHAKLTAILHTQLLRYHSTILLARPFFLSKLMEQQDVPPTSKSSSNVTRLSQLCFDASVQTLELIQDAHVNRLLPKRNPFILEFVFSATLVVLSNQFFALHLNDRYHSSITNAISFMEYCATSDIQAHRYCYIIGAFKVAVAERAQRSISSVEERFKRSRTHEANLSDSPSPGVSKGHVVTQSSCALSPETPRSDPTTAIPTRYLIDGSDHDSEALWRSGSVVGSSDGTLGSTMSPASSRRASTPSHANVFQRSDICEGRKVDPLPGVQQYRLDNVCSTPCLMTPDMGHRNSANWYNQVGKPSPMLHLTGVNAAKSIVGQSQGSMDLHDHDYMRTELIHASVTESTMNRQFRFPTWD